MAEILVVDDEDLIRDLFSTIIESLGHTAIKAKNGREAYDLLQSNPTIDLMILDMLMPVMSGRELIEIMTKEAIRCELPVIIVSGYVGEKNINDLLKREKTTFVQKPLKIKILINEINEFLGSKV